MAKEMEDFKKISVKQVRGVRGRTQRVKRTLEALGLGKIGKEKVLPFNPAVRGMVVKVRHLVDVKAVDVQAVSE